MMLTTRYNRYAHGNIIGASAVPASAFARLLDEDGLDVQRQSPDFGYELSNNRTTWMPSARQMGKPR
jgi:hypothetical protein